jgi:hypothetical protein
MGESYLFFGRRSSFSSKSKKPLKQLSKKHSATISSLTTDSVNFFIFEMS